MRRCARPWLRWIRTCRSFRFAPLREQVSAQFSAAAADRAAHFVFRNAFACPGLDRTLRSDSPITPDAAPTRSACGWRWAPIAAHVVRLVLRGAFGLIVVGLCIGLPLTFGAGRFLGHQLYGMNPYNPAVTFDRGCDAGIIGVGRVVDSSPAGQRDFAVGSFARRVTRDYARLGNCSRYLQMASRSIGMNL